MSGEAEINTKTAIVPVQSASLAEQAATAAVLENMQKASLEPPPAPEAALFSCALDPQEMVKLISEVMTLPVVFWSTGLSLAYSLWLSSLPPAAATMDPIAQHAA